MNYKVFSAAIHCNNASEMNDHCKFIHFNISATTELNSNTHSYDNRIINYQVPLKFHKFKNMIGHFSNFKDKNLNSSLLWPKFLLSWGLILLIWYSLPRNKCILNCYSLLGYSTFLLKKKPTLNFCLLLINFLFLIL